MKLPHPVLDHLDNHLVRVLHVELHELRTRSTSRSATRATKKPYPMADRRHLHVRHADPYRSANTLPRPRATAPGSSLHGAEHDHLGEGRAVYLVRVAARPG